MMIPAMRQRNKSRPQTTAKMERNRFPTMASRSCASRLMNVIFKDHAHLLLDIIISVFVGEGGGGASLY